MKVYLVLTIALVFNATANILMKQSARAPGGTASNLVDKFLSPSGAWFVAGLTCFGLALIFYRWALENLNLSIAYPIMTAVGYAIVVVFSVFAFREALNLKQIIGLVLILIGVALVSQQAPTAMR